jgi:hypothetical protein
LFLDRLFWIYENKGIIALFLSGRDVFLNKGLYLYFNEFT